MAKPKKNCFTRWKGRCLTEQQFYATVGRAKERCPSGMFISRPDGSEVCEDNPRVSIPRDPRPAFGPAPKAPAPAPAPMKKPGMLQCMRACLRR